MSMATPNVHVLVTGGSGFVGTAIVKALATEHPRWRITILDIAEPSDLPAEVGFLKADIRKPTEVYNAISSSKPRVVVHAAGIVPRGPLRYNRHQDETVSELNVRGTENVLQAAQDCSVEAFIFTSSSQVIADDLDHDYPNFDETVPYPDSSLVYGASKAKAEILVLNANRKEFPTCALRPSVIPGEQDYQLIPAIHACIAKGESLIQIGKGDNLYDFTFVDNVAYAHVLAVENLLSTKTAAGQAILISNGQPITFRDFCLAVWAEFDHVPPFTIQIPTSVAWVAGLLSEWVTQITAAPATLSRGSIKDAYRTRYANLEKSRRLLNYEPRVNLWDGIRISCKAYKRQLYETHNTDKI